jgi:molybdate-binding protein/DNA-binding transcriptional regulator YhcF (GntR family)
MPDSSPLIEINCGQVGVPIYRQIADEIRQMVATNRLRPGERLPTVRQLARNLALSPGTVARAYIELEQEGVVESRRGGGTMIAHRNDGERGAALRQVHLFNNIGASIVQALSQGFRPEEIEAAFSVHLARWREERQRKEKSEKENAPRHSKKTICIVASHDLALDLLVSQIKRSSQAEVDVTYAGSLGGLIALQENRADLAGIHLLDGESGEYNYPYVRHILPSRETAILHLAFRIQGLMFAKSNPKKIRGIEDLKRADLRFLNRQSGSGTRVLLDLKLRQHDIEPHEIKGYGDEVDTHLSVARAIAGGDADVGLGIEAAARACHLDFLPLFEERYDLVMPIEKYRSKRLAPILKTVKSHSFRSLVAGIGGYDTSQTGAVSFCS